MLAILNKFLSWARHSDKEGEALPSALKNQFAKGAMSPILPLARQTQIPASVKLYPGTSDDCKTGSIVRDSDTLGWREFVWSPAEHENCQWHCVRWRFYDDGLICFDAKMSSSNQGVRLGQLQGHRIELREKNGLLLGVWTAEFYVRKGLAPLGFQANIVDDHAPLKLHFAELSEKQEGCWLRR